MEQQVTPEQQQATALNREVLESVGVTCPVSATCPECGTECLADPEAPLFVCGYCGNGPFEAVTAPQEAQ